MFIAIQITHYYLLAFLYLLPKALKGDPRRHWFGRTVYSPNSRSSVKRWRRITHVYISLGSHIRICYICCSANQPCTLDNHDSSIQPLRCQSKFTTNNRDILFVNLVYKVQDEQHRKFYLTHTASIPTKDKISTAK